MASELKDLPPKLVYLVKVALLFSGTLIVRTFLIIWVLN